MKKIRARHLAIFDLHIPHQVHLNEVYKFIKWYKPTDLIIGGDFLNLEWASHWNASDFPILGLSKLSNWLKEEFQTGQDVLNNFRKVAGSECTIYYIPGNHENWLRQLVTKYPSMLDNVHLMNVDDINSETDFSSYSKQFLALLLNSVLQLNKFKIKVLPLDAPLYLNRIYYIHGHQIKGINPAKTAVEKYKKTIVFGHFHTHSVYTSTSLIDNKEIHQGICVPCMSNLDPGYISSLANNWLNGFYIANCYDDYFVSNVIPIINGKISLLDGNILN